MEQQLQPIEYSNQRILTTQQVADFYDTDANNITVNFFRHKDRYIEGKHYFFLEGEALQNWICTLQDVMSKEEINKTRKLYLWTKQGTFRHAKSLNTDRAWQIYETLEENYFNPQNLYFHEAAVLKELKDHLSSLRDSLIELSTEAKLGLREIDDKIRHSKLLIATYERKEHQSLTIPIPDPELPEITPKEKILWVLSTKFKRRSVNSYTIAQAGSTLLRAVGSIEVRKILDKELVPEGKVTREGTGKTALYKSVI